MPDVKTKMPRHVRLGEMLERLGLLTQDELEDALVLSRARKMRLGDYLVSIGRLTEEQVLEAVSSQLHIQLYKPDDYTVNPELKTLIPAEVANRNRLVPLMLHDGVLYTALIDGSEFQAIDEIEDLTRYQVEPVLCSRKEFVRLYRLVYGEHTALNEMFAEYADKETEAEAEAEEAENDEEISTDTSSNGVPVIRMVNLILTEGVQVGASDIHINPEKNAIYVRYRVEGVLRRASQVPLKMGPAVVSRIKIMGNMDIAESRIPQDGRFTVKIEGREINVRVSTLPTTHGENIVMRLLDMSTQRVYTLPNLGMKDDDRALVEECAKKPYGMILSTGPTGSGKSSSLYAIIQMLNNENVNIITLEDPVEYRMEGVRQVQLNTKAGMTFSSGLRAILRQDPDIIMVGEIRDRETAEIAVQAALTGHLVLSTLHTNDALSAVYRLVDMGVEPYLAASVLLCTFAQRLVRTVCPHCKEIYEPNPIGLAAFGLKPEDGPFYHGAGCDQCGKTGFAGRTAVFEIFKMSPDYQEDISHGVSMQELYRKARAQGHRTMIQDAARKIKEGRTTVEEALRVTMT